MDEASVATVLQKFISLVIGTFGHTKKRRDSGVGQMMGQFVPVSRLLACPVVIFYDGTNVHSRLACIKSSC